VREVIAIDHKTKLEPVLRFFKRGEFQMAIVTQVTEDPEGLTDPVLKKVGIVTFEDIIEELLQEEIEDERDVKEARGERRRIR
jgi:CBS domain containing-hemolysin-like protein